MGMENLLFLMGGGFKFYCLQLKNPVGVPKILVFFLVGMGSHRVCDTGVF